jgi:hypothetical protein
METAPEGCRRGEYGAKTPIAAIKRQQWLD